MEKTTKLEGLTTEQLLAEVAKLRAENAQLGGAKKEVKLGQNMDMKVKGNILTITVDLSKEFGLSSSLKSMKVATSGGNIDIPNTAGIKIGLNIYKPVK